MKEREKEERVRKAAEKDSLLAQMDDLHGRIIELNNDVKLASLKESEDEKAVDWVRKAEKGYKEQVSRYAVKIDELQYDNQKLRDQLEINVREREEETKELEAEVEESRKIASRLASRNERLKKRKGKIDATEELDGLISELDEAKLQMGELGKC